ALPQPLCRHANGDLRAGIDGGHARRRRVRVHRRLSDRDQGCGAQHLRLVWRRSSVATARPKERLLQGRPTIAVIGGNGDLGSALAKRWAAAGYPIVLGSRSKEKAEAAAREMNATHGSAVSGEDNRTAAAKADIVVIAVPYANHEGILNEIKPAVTGKMRVHAAVTGKIVVDGVGAVVPPKVSVVKLPPDGSAALRAQRLLAGAARVQSAFHNVSAPKLKSGGNVDCDVLVFGDDKDARAIVI